MALAGPRHFLWEGALRDARWAEGPHLYRVDGAYYLLAAEGGTAYDHAVVVARSRRVTGPYEPCPRNPVLTSRHLGRGAPVIGAGHADLVQAQDGDWWAVLLAMRPMADGTWNTGRETFLVPVAWEDGWPVFGPGEGRVLLEERAPALAPHPWPAPPRVDTFDAPELGPEWLFLRTPRERWWSLTDRPGHLRLRLRPPSLADRANPSFVGRRVAHASYTASAALEVSPAGPASGRGWCCCTATRSSCGWTSAGSSGARSSSCAGSAGSTSSPPSSRCGPVPCGSAWRRAGSPTGSGSATSRDGGGRSARWTAAC
jgi:xylan 1,4-beta-xylosidase